MNRRAVEAAADRCVPAFLAPHGEKVQYLAVGGFNTVVGYAVWAALYRLLSQSMSYATIMVVAYAIAIANAYVWYRLIVFRSHDSVRRELPRFSTVYLATMAVNLIVFPIAVRRLPWNAYAIQALFTLGVVVASYTAHRSISFRVSRAPAAATRSMAKKGNALTTISIVTGCYNEEENVAELYRRVRDVLESLPGYDYEHLFIDNASTDRTVPILRAICDADPRVKVIVNTRNFGHVRSPYHGLLQARGDAVCYIAADLQDPPELIRDFVAKWEEGYKVVVAVKKQSFERRSMFFVRGLYYRVINRLSDVPLIENFTGYGLYDRVVVDALRDIDDPYPYFRGLVSDLGYEHVEIPYVQQRRQRGVTKNNFYTLYDLAMLGITNHSKVPLRLAMMAGFLLSVLALGISLIYLVLKLMFWQTFDMGLAPLLIGIYFFGSVQLLFIGILGEYIGSIQTQVYHRPHVVERERINFEPNEGGSPVGAPAEVRQEVRVPVAPQRQGDD